MRSSTSVSVAVMALLAGPTFATPFAAPEASSLNGERDIIAARAAVAEPPTAPAKSGGSGIGTSIIGGVAGSSANNIITKILNKIESLFKRDLELAFNKRDATTIAGLTAEEKVQIKEALIAKLKAYPGVTARAVVEDEPVSSTPPKSSSGSGAAIAGGIAAGGAGAFITNILNKIESLFRREHDGLGQRDSASTLDSLTVDEKALIKAALIAKVKTALPDVVSRGIGGVLGGGIAAGAGSALVGSILAEIEKLFRRSNDHDLVQRKTEGLFQRDLDSDKRDTTTIGSMTSEEKAQVKAALLSALNTYPGVGPVEIVHDPKTRGLFSAKPAGGAPKTSSGAGTAIAGGIAAGGAGALITNILQKIEGLFSRDEMAEIYARSVVDSWSIDELD